MSRTTSEPSVMEMKWLAPNAGKFPDLLMLTLLAETKPLMTWVLLKQASYCPLGQACCSAPSREGTLEENVGPRMRRALAGRSWSCCAIWRSPYTALPNWSSRRMPLVGDSPTRKRTRNLPPIRLSPKRFLRKMRTPGAHSRLESKMWVLVRSTGSCEAAYGIGSQGSH